MWRTDSLEKTLMLGKIKGRRRRGWQRMSQNLYINVHSSIIHNSQKVEITQTSINWWTDRHCLSIMEYSVQFSRSVMSASLQPHEPQHARPPCPSPTPRVHPKPCPSSQWCHPTISSSVIPFSSCLQYFPASGSFRMSWLFASGGQSVGVSVSISVLPMNIQDWFPLGWTGWTSLQAKGLSRIFSKTAVQKHQFFSAQLSL